MDSRLMSDWSWTSVRPHWQSHRYTRFIYTLRSKNELLYTLLLLLLLPSNTKWVYIYRNIVNDFPFFPLGHYLFLRSENEEIANAKISSPSFLPSESCTVCCISCPSTPTLMPKHYINYFYIMFHVVTKLWALKSRG